MQIDKERDSESSIGLGNGTAPGESGEEIVLKDLTDADAKDFNTHLNEARAADLSDLERTGCVTRGRDERNQHVIVLITHLGLAHGERPEVAFRRMLLLFIRRANEIVGAPYSVVYAHTGFDIMNQYPLIYKFYSILPRAYKKNLLKMHVLHPNMGIRMFFEFSRVFLSKKFYNKLCLYETILEFQKAIPPTQLALPHKFLRKEDEDRGLKYCGRLGPLSRSFDPALGASRVLDVCATFLRERGAFQQRGLFRVAGDEGELSLIKVRLQYAHRRGDYRERIFLSENKDYIIVGDLGSLSKPPTQPSSADAVGNSKLSDSYTAASQAEKAGAGSSSAAAMSRAQSKSDLGSVGKQAGKAPARGSSSSSSSLSQSEADDANDTDDADLQEEVPTSVVVVTNSNTAAQVFKMAISHLPEPLVPGKIYTELINVTRKHEPSGFNQEWERGVATLLAGLSFPHLSTLVYVVSFLREVAAESAINSMDSSNLAIIFAPNVFRSDMIDPMKAVMEMRLSKIILRELLDRRHILQQAMHMFSDRRRSSSSGAESSSSCNDSKQPPPSMAADRKPSSLGGTGSSCKASAGDHSRLGSSAGSGGSAGGGSGGSRVDSSRRDSADPALRDYSACEFIFENPVLDASWGAQDVLTDELAGKGLRAEDVRDITDGFGPKLMSRLNMIDNTRSSSRSNHSNRRGRDSDIEKADEASEEEDEADDHIGGVEDSPRDAPHQKA